MNFLDLSISNKYILTILSNRTPNAFNKLLDKNFRKANIKLTRQQWSVLAVLWEEDGYTQSQIAEKTFRDDPGVTRLLDNLERSGYLMRIVGRTDRRQRLIYLTPKSKEVKREAIKIMDETIRNVIKGIPIEDIKVFKKTFEKIYQNLKVYNSESDKNLKAK